MREIVLDTETTGLDPAEGHRIIEIGCIEILHTIPTGQIFHVYIDPQRDIPEDAVRVHGITAEFLAGKPVFADIASEFLAFIGDAKLVAHNAAFDMRFLNAELGLLGLEPIDSERVVDTLALARRRHPGASNSLDALCNRYGIDNTRRTKHGALLDSEILADVYAELLGGRQAALTFETATALRQDNTHQTPFRQRPVPLESALSSQERDAHRAFIAKLGDKAIWVSYLPQPENSES
ncbi:DNA polymerase III subunit epsilon [Beijerinckia indica]|uniref:DNA polymerase III subunit epsilon n=1 Tax=Beijerinckia indica subsp. indica (strain ATCC 9039 / DSM 1715 / NCIMB 8712) TaxID=395963 RepID=B2ICZ3_BEII9|nr:DNA polymerase III subunit epsilon [Beijerinckia indica]ACB96758.1 DNA polymerase III, epsilon subunit [Beijerinckia indica subsp. indica ATCC 9039]